MEKKPKKEKKKKDPNALKLRRIISNNLYVLKIIHEVAPSYLPTYFIWSVVNVSLSFMSEIWLVREVVNRYQMGRPVSELIIMGAVLALVWIIWYSITDSFGNLLYPKYMQRIVERIEHGLFEKAADVELECY